MTSSRDQLENPVAAGPGAGPPVELTERVREFVAGVEEQVPGLLHAVHLTGSGASGDWQHDSDIDLVFETSRAVTVVDAAALVPLHATTRLVVTVETGRAVSKSEAAEFAAGRWPEYAGLLARVLASRRGASRQFTVSDARLSVALILGCVALAD